VSETSRSRWEFAKSEVSGHSGLVVGGKPEAAEAGVRMLEEGGNAVDAAVAAGWAVAVVEPWMNGIGGAGAMVVHHAGKQTAMDFGARAPRSAGPNTFVLDPGGGTGAFGWPAVTGQANEIGHLASGVPGLVAGLSLAHERFGRLPREVVMQPAIELAESGFEADWHTTLMIGLNLEQLTRQPTTARIFLREGAFPLRPESRFAKADRVRQPNRGMPGDREAWPARVLLGDRQCDGRRNGENGASSLSMTFGPTRPARSRAASRGLSRGGGDRRSRHRRIVPKEILSTSGA
jgi:gamma-glutamyltranspeptidase/glutathione hydrolase